MAVVAALRVAPVKGLATVSRQTIRLDATGAAEDRRLFLVDDAGEVVTLRRHPQLVQVRPELDLDHGVLTATLPDGSVVSSSTDDTGETVVAELYGKPRVGRVVRGAVGDALSEVAGERIRLVLGEAGVGWDEGPVSLLGQASAAAVAGDGRDRARYRMLIEVAGTQPFEEDSWVGKTLVVGDATVAVTHQLQRCVIITQSPATGEKDWDGLRQLVSAGRKHLCLGVIGDVAQPGTVDLGASISIRS